MSTISIIKEYLPVVALPEAIVATLVIIAVVGIAVVTVKRRRAIHAASKVPVLATRLSRLDLESGTGQQIQPGKPAVSLDKAKKPRLPMPLLLPVDSSTPDTISAGISSPRTCRPQEAVVAHTGFSPMRMASLNRLLSIFPSPRKKVAPKSNLGFANGDATADTNVGRTYSYTWAKIHGQQPESPRGPPTPSPFKAHLGFTVPQTPSPFTTTARMGSTMMPGSPSPYAIAARLASSLPFNRADAVQGGQGEADRTSSGMSDMAQTIQPTYFPEDLDANRNWTSEVAPAGMPRIVVRWNSNGRGSSGDGSLSAGTSARSSTEGGAQGMRRRSTRPSRGTDDWSATGGGQPQLPVSDRGFKRSSTMRDEKEPMPQVIEEETSPQPSLQSLGTRRPFEDSPRTVHPQVNSSRKATSSLERIKREALRDRDASMLVSAGPPPVRRYQRTAGGATRQMRVVEPDRMAKSASQAEMLVVLRIEEVLPRPAAGLLAKMLRLAPVDTIAVLGCAHPVLVLRPKTQYQISVAVFQADSLGTIDHCNLYLAHPNGTGVDLHLTGQADDVYPDRLWQACTVWDPSDCGLMHAEREDCRTATVMNMQVQVACSGSQGSPQRREASTALHVKLIGRGSLQHLEDYSMGAAWDQASDVLTAWQLDPPAWEGAEFPLLMCSSNNA